MSIMNQVVLLGVGLMIVSGCATSTSDDPRTGGLLGYWQHGEDGYQQRLDRRQTEVDAVHREGETERAETASLQQQRDAARAELEAQRAALSEMAGELEALNQACRDLEIADPEQGAKQRAVVTEAESLQNQITDLEQDTDLMIRERQRRISQLQKELKLLRERASLLTTL